MTPDETPAVDPARLGTAVWVHHRGDVHLLPICPDTRPYSTAAFRRVLEGWEPGDPITPQRVTLDDDSDVLVVGSGFIEDPMTCAEMDNRPLPVCRCGELADHFDGPDDGYFDMPPVTRRYRPMVTYYLPGDGPPARLRDV